MKQAWQLLRTLDALQKCDEWGYLAIGLGASLPCLLLPVLLQPQSERQRPFWQRHWVKANVWIAIFSFIGNYFWTHYFYDLLGASYTFKSWRLNDVSGLASSLHSQLAFSDLSASDITPLLPQL